MPPRPASHRHDAAGSTTERAQLASFGNAWEEFVRALRRRGQARSRDRGPRLSLSQWDMLRAVGSEGTPVGGLAAAAGVTAATATGVLDGLERAGVVVRERRGDDRRTVIVRLTAQGQRQLERTQRHITSQRRRLYERLDRADRANAERLLRQLAQIIDEL